MTYFYVVFPRWVGRIAADSEAGVTLMPLFENQLSLVRIISVGHREPSRLSLLEISC